jgi:glucose/arabinose dehydrogenase
MRLHHLALVLLAAACSKRSAREPGAPVDDRPPNARHQSPAFEGQTRAPARTAEVRYQVETRVDGLEHPWALAFLDDGAMLVTERPGRMRMVSPDGTLSEPIAGLPEVDARGQGGLLDVAVGPDGAIVWCYAEPRDGGNGTAVARGRLVRGEAPRLDEVDVIWRMQPTLDSEMHFGCRIVFDRSGTMMVGLGERSILEGRHQAQRLDSAFGKVIRIRPDGSIPDDNPLVGKAGALPEIYSWGHRNIQAAALHPQTGQLWVVEHGARGGDEINVVRPGRDYGWPTIAYGIEYSGDPIGEGKTAQEGMDQPIYYWDPVIAPSGMAFYHGDRFPAWKGSLLVGGLAGEQIARLTLDGERVIGEERLLTDRGRIRDVRVGPDVLVYALTDAEDGQLLVLTPAGG